MRNLVFAVTFTCVLCSTSPSIAQTLYTSEHVYSINSSSKLEEFVWKQSFYGWTSLDVGSNSTSAAPNSAIAGFPNPPDQYGANWYDFFYYVGANQHVYEIGWNMGVGSYETADVTAEASSPLATSGTALTAFSNEPQAGQVYPDRHVYYISGTGSNLHIYELYRNPNSRVWTYEDLTAATGNKLAAAGSPLSSFTDSYGEAVFYLGQNGHVYQLNHASGWGDADLTAITGSALAVAGSPLTSFTDSYGEAVFYLGQNGHVYQLNWNHVSGWGHADLTTLTGSAVAAAGSPLTSFTDSYGEAVFYFGQNSHVYQLNWNHINGWGHADITAITGSALAATGSRLTSYGDSVGEAVFYSGPSNHLYQLNWNHVNGWGHADITALTGQTLANAGSVLTSFTCKEDTIHPGCL